MRPIDGEYEVLVARDLMVPMRDGVRLATDLYLPARDGQALPGHWPALLVRTPYNKSLGPASSALRFARHGYLVAVQDCRGRYLSEGRFFPFVDEPEDGYDTVTWLAGHPACDGQVGTFGGSHLAWVQFHMATQAPPGLKTMIPHYGPTNAFHHSMREGGALHLWWLGWMLRLAENGSHRAQSEPHLARGVQAQPLLPWLASLPWQRGQSPLRHFPDYEEALFRMMEEDRYSEFWRRPGLAMDESFAAFPEIPILWIGGWYDYYPHAISDSFARFAALGRQDQCLLMGPWDHSGFGSVCGDVDFGSSAAVTLPELQLRWFDFWLKGQGEPPLRAPVRVFVMGDVADEGVKGRRGEGVTEGPFPITPSPLLPFTPSVPAGGQRTAYSRLAHGGTWRDLSAWPPVEAEQRRYYLQPGGGLASEPARAEAAATTYSYDPRDPVPSLGWCYVSDPVSGYDVPPGPRDLVQPAPLLGKGQAGLPLAARRDVLVFSGPPLAEALCVIGPIEARLWIASDAPDTDFTVRLSDVYPPSPDYPSGYALPVAEGILRARFRESMSDPKPLVPGEPTEIRLTVSPTANCFQAGHCLRLDVSSSNFPRFEPNRNTWGFRISDFGFRISDGEDIGSDPAPPNPKSEIRNPKSSDRRVRVAENCVYHDSSHPSHVVLWVMPG